MKKAFSAKAGRTYGVARRRIEVGREHRVVSEAMAQGDAAAAEDAARSHIRNAGELRMMLMSEAATAAYSSE